MPHAPLALTVSCFEDSSAVAATAENKQSYLTIYNGDLALIEHTRPMTLAAGRHGDHFAAAGREIMSTP
jgi:hypothetical protein